MPQKGKPASASKKGKAEDDGFSAMLRKTVERNKLASLAAASAIAASAIFSVNSAVSTIRKHKNDTEMLLYTEQISAEPLYLSNTNKISFEVDAVRQPDALARTFTVNGFTSDKMWVQVGLCSFGNTIENVKIYGDKTVTKDFTLAYDVFNPDEVLIAGSGLTGHIAFSGKVNDNDKVVLSLEIKNNKVIMSGYDKQTGALASAEYPMSEGSVFVPTTSTEFEPHNGGGGHPTGIMDETLYVYPMQQKGKLSEQNYVMITPISYDSARLKSSYFGQDLLDLKNSDPDPNREFKSFCESDDEKSHHDLVCDDGTEVKLSDATIKVK